MSYIQIYVVLNETPVNFFTISDIKSSNSFFIVIYEEAEISNRIYIPLKISVGCKSKY